MPKNAPKIWTITDGKIGDRVQCVGIAERLNENFEERVVSPKAPWSWFMPTGPIPFKDAPHRSQSPIAPPFPDVVIASGRRSVGYLRTLKRHSPKTITVFLKNPRNPFLKPDITWAPLHDRLKKRDGLIQTLTSPHGITLTKLEAEGGLAKTRFGAFNQTPIAIILGGDSGSVKYNQAVIADFTQKLQNLPKEGFDYFLTQSRRTPKALVAKTIEALKDHSLWHQGLDGGKNPYFEILAHCEQYIVTGDSHNMVSETLFTGRPSYVYRPNGLSKLNFFLDKLEEQASIRNFQGQIGLFPAKPIDASPQIAAPIKKLILQRFQ